MTPSELATCRTGVPRPKKLHRGAQKNLHHRLRSATEPPPPLFGLKADLRAVLLLGWYGTGTVCIVWTPAKNQDTAYDL